VTGSGELVTRVGLTTLVLKYTGLSCVGCEIENFGGNAFGHGVLRFTGVTAVKPSTCAVPGGEIETVELIADAGYMGGAGSGNTVLFEPAASTEFTTVFLEGPSCSIAGPYEVKGKVFMRTNNATGVYAANQTVTSSGAINADGGGSLEFGVEAAELNGTATFLMSGTKAGQPFGTHG
jgi:hypothetical protein